MGPREGWGFCDKSCKMTGYTTPDTYHKMVWKFPPKRNSQCYHSKNIAKWYHCIVSILPKTSVFRFQENKDGSLTFLTAIKENPLDMENFSPARGETIMEYQQPCHGDSGSGHWMYNPKDERSAIVGVTSFSSGKDGKYVCGAQSFMLKTTYPRILGWIKKHSGIKLKQD